jgi:hypothetical protein
LRFSVSSAPIFEGKRDVCAAAIIAVCVRAPPSGAGRRRRVSDRCLPHRAIDRDRAQWPHLSVVPPNSRRCWPRQPSARYGVTRGASCPSPPCPVHMRPRPAPHRTVLFRRELRRPLLAGADVRNRYHRLLTSQHSCCHFPHSCLSGRPRGALLWLLLFPATSPAARCCASLGAMALAHHTTQSPPPCAALALPSRGGARVSTKYSRLADLGLARLA